MHGCYGPLTMEDVDEDLIESFDYSTVGAAWIRANEEHFTPYVPRVPDIPAMVTTIHHPVARARPGRPS